jgi:hypothetical protein
MWSIVTAEKETCPVVASTVFGLEAELVVIHDS